MEFEVFVRRKNVVVGELYLAFEVLAAAFGVELNAMLWHSVGFMFVLVAMAMRARFCRVNEAARQMMVFGAIVELHVPPYRDKEHHKGRQKGTDLQDSFFHAAKLQKVVDCQTDFVLLSLQNP